MYPHFTSARNHPEHIFLGLIRTETIRYSRLSKTKPDYDYLLQLFKLRLLALTYPDSVITSSSFPWLPYHLHRQHKLQRSTDKNKPGNKKPSTFYVTKYNKHARTDKIVQTILHKFHNTHLPPLSKAYCNSTKLSTLLLTNKGLHQKLVSAITCLDDSV